MRKVFLLFTVIIILVSAVVFGRNLNKKPRLESQEINIGRDMSVIDVKSPLFSSRSKIPAKFTCDGDNVNPQIDISGVPENAKSLVLIVDDPDAPGKTWSHWLLWNIKPDIGSIRENSVPEGGVEGTNDFGKLGYGGPCPPSGSHRYFFKVYALDIGLNLGGSAKRDELERSMQGHIIGQGELIGEYSR